MHNSLKKITNNLPYVRSYYLSGILQQVAVKNRPAFDLNIAIIWDGRIKTTAFLTILSHFTFFSDHCEFSKTRPTQTKASYHKNHPPYLARNVGCNQKSQIWHLFNFDLMQNPGLKVCCARCKKLLY